MKNATRAAAHPVMDYLEGWQRLRAMHPDLSRPEGWSYGSYEELVLHLGKPFERKPLPTGVAQGELGDCFANAFNTVMMNAGQWRYVEGYAAGPIPVNHAWVLDIEDGKVFDPTWPEDSDHEAYVGIQFPFRFVADTIHEQGVYGILANDYLKANRILEVGPELWLPKNILTRSEINDQARAKYDGKFRTYHHDHLMAIARKQAAWRTERETYL